MTTKTIDRQVWDWTLAATATRPTMRAAVALSIATQIGKSSVVAERQQAIIARIDAARERLENRRAAEA